MKVKKSIVFILLLALIISFVPGTYNLSYADSVFSESGFSKNEKLLGQATDLSSSSFVDLIENGQILKEIVMGEKDVPLKPVFKINFPNGIYIDPERENTKGLDFRYNSEYIHIYDLDNNKEVAVHLEIVMPGKYNPNESNKGKLDKSTSITVEPQEDLRAGRHYRLLIDKEMIAKHGRSVFGEDKIMDFKTIEDQNQGSEESGFRKAVLNTRGDCLLLKELPKNTMNLEYRILKDSESFGEWHSLRTDENGTAKIEKTEELNELQEGTSKVEIRVSEKERVSAVHVIGKEEPEAFQSIGLKFSEEEGQLKLEGFPTNANNFEYRISIDGKDFGDDWCTFPTRGKGESPEIPVPSNAIKNTSKIELAEVIGWRISKAILPIKREKSQGPSFSTAILNLSGDKLLLKGLPQNADNLEYRLSEDGKNFSQWNAITSNDSGVAEISVTDKLQEGISKVEVRTVESGQVSEAVVKIVEKEKEQDGGSSEDTETLYIKDKSPSSGAANIDINSKIEIVFSEAIDKDSIDGNIVLKKSKGTDEEIVDIDIRYDEKQAKVTVIPKEKLAANKNYKVIVKTGITNLHEKNLTSEEIWEFKTTDTGSISLKGIKLVEDGEVSKDIATGSSDIPLKPIFKINFSNGIYRVKDHNFQHIHLYDLDNNKEKVPVDLKVAAPGAYGDFFDEKENQNENNIEKSRSIVLVPSDSLKEGRNYRLFIGKDVMANNGFYLQNDIKIDFITKGIEKDDDEGSRSTKGSSSKKRESVDVDVADSSEVVTITSEAIDEAKKENKDLAIKDKKATVVIPVEALKTTEKLKVGILDIKEEIHESKELNNKNSFEVVMNIGEKDIKKIDDEFTIEVPLPETVENMKRIVAYKLDEETNKWNYIDSTVYDDKIVFKTNDLGKYLVGESTKSFTDIQKHWAKDSIETMVDREIVSGIDDKNFAPNNKITRAEAVTLLVKALDIDQKADISAFYDVDKNAWYAEFMSKGVEAGIIRGDNNKQLRPNDYISREEIACIISNAYKYKGNEISHLKDMHFTDEDCISPWARKHVQEIYSLNIIKGRPDNSFGAKDNATRAETVIMLENLLKKLS